MVIARAYTFVCSVFLAVISLCQLLGPVRNYFLEGEKIGCNPPPPSTIDRVEMIGFLALLVIGVTLIPISLRRCSGEQRQMASVFYVLWGVALIVGAGAAQLLALIFTNLIPLYVSLGVQLCTALAVALPAVIGWVGRKRAPTRVSG